MRAIAAEAGVDAALITHFFGSKANLLGAAIDWPSIWSASYLGSSAPGAITPVSGSSRCSSAPGTRRAAAIR